ncbi:DM13 domain-containing protein [Fibrella aquatilis]|uniref:DM13 domain-containing protein n=1 Tax=Fibrella aquatilis TaxID=2817059 RepID=A0A939G7A9_9BACT|nr:DM13 domain-containing protein [Fibrella aquatilis]MBO0932345.1 DM13 domain-containing protein [Fibrella aquatilis]
MKQFTFAALLVLGGFLAGCRSAETTVLPSAPVAGTPISSTVTSGSTTTSFDTTGYRRLSRGAFMNGIHSVSGTVSVYEKAGVRTLVFTDFRTDGGPDLRIYVAENTALRNFVEVTKLDKSGNFSVDLPANVDPAKQRSVLIWCKAFSVLFGSAELN